MTGKRRRCDVTEASSPRALEAGSASSPGSLVTGGDATKLGDGGRGGPQEGCSAGAGVVVRPQR